MSLKGIFDNTHAISTHFNPMREGNENFAIKLLSKSFVFLFSFSVRYSTLLCLPLLRFTVSEDAGIESRTAA